MAGEIQLNSTTMATESSGTITLSNVDSATNRTNLGLGSIATQAADSVSISGGNITGGTIGSGVVFPADHILQVVYQSGTTETSGTNTTQYCGWTASITLSSASNKIYLSLILPFQVTRSGGQAYFENVSLYHQKGTLTTSGSGGTLSLTGTSPSNIADLYPYRLGAGGTKDGVITHQRIITTDNVNNHFTFSAVINSDMSSGYFNRQFGDGALYNITLMEVAG